MSPAESRDREEPRTNVAEFTVSELSGALKRTIEDAYGYVRVRGEISGFKRAASGHLYFALKDERALIDGVCWRGTAGKLGFQPEDGLEVVASGRITTYAGRSKYQIVIDRLEPAGAGALMALLEERKKKLAAEGLFDSERKRALPFLPEVIGVVTSPTGAVVQDILHRIGERFPRHVLLWPVAVQGDKAKDEIAAAIAGFNRLPVGGPVPKPDVLIVARGGGSLEDLWAFNEEIVVRAAADSAIPLISAVGHETDTTLIDLAADHRTPTPTAAAELAVPVRAELSARVADHGARLFNGIDRRLKEQRQAIDGLARGLPDPVTLLGQASQRLDELAERLPHGLCSRIDRARASLAEASARLGTPTRLLKDATLRLQGPSNQLDQLFKADVKSRARDLERLSQRLGLDELAIRLPRHRATLDDLALRKTHAFDGRLSHAADRLRNATSLLQSLSYQGTLARGFALVRDEQGRPVTSAAEAATKTRVDLEFADGQTPALIAADRPAKPVKKKRRAHDGGDQGQLL
ncbi:MAG: exodeoxyribonuclease VII large subunit [Alphaproteobacteria bacterium]|nr:exodeoxyribonuclease VII large subunit [Alphaproteobacteria bacterium]